MTGAVDPFVALSDDAAHEAAVAARIAERERRERAAEAASWLGTLRDLAERRAGVAVGCAAGRSHRGALVAVGVDHLAVQTPTGALVLVALETVRSLRPDPEAHRGAAMGEREIASDRRLADVVEQLAQRDGRVAIALRDVPDPLQGIVLGVGDDVLSLRLDTVQRETVIVPLHAIAELLVSP